MSKVMVYPLLAEISASASIQWGVTMEVLIGTSSLRPIYASVPNLWQSRGPYAVAGASQRRRPQEPLHRPSPPTSPFVFCVAVIPGKTKLLFNIYQLWLHQDPLRFSRRCFQSAQTNPWKKVVKNSQPPPTSG